MSSGRIQIGCLRQRQKRPVGSSVTVIAEFQQRAAFQTVTPAGEIALSSQSGSPRPVRQEKLKCSGRGACC